MFQEYFSISVEADSHSGISSCSAFIIAGDIRTDPPIPSVEIA